MVVVPPPTTAKESAMANLTLAQEMDEVYAILNKVRKNSPTAEEFDDGEYADDWTMDGLGADMYDEW